MLATCKACVAFPLQVYDVNSSKTFENLENWRDEFLIQVTVFFK